MGKDRVTDYLVQVCWDADERGEYAAGEHIADKYSV